MSILKRLFGGKAEVKAPASEAYGDFRIFPNPMNEGQNHRIAARIEKDIGGETKVHDLVRADTFQSHDQAVEASVAKAKQVIDEQGDKLFR